MRKRTAFTLVELLVVIAIIGVLVALLLPAIQAAREAARRASCQSNIRQLALAVQAYHDAERELPSMYSVGSNATLSLAFGLNTHGWRTQILPYIEEQPLHDSLSFAEGATDATNQAAVNHVVYLFACPSTPRSTRNVRGLWHGRSQFDEARQAAPTDYNGSSGYVEAGVASRKSICDPSITQYLWEELTTPGVFGEVKYAKVVWDPPKIRKASFKDISDGLSATALVLERAGTPDQYFDGGAAYEPHDPPQFRTWGNVGLWAISGCEQFNKLYRQTDKPLVNFDNLLGLYAFHPGGANVGMADCSVRFLDASVGSDVVLGLISRSGEEVGPVAAAQ